MVQSTDVLFFVPPVKPVRRPMDVLFPSFQDKRSSENVLVLHSGLLSIAGYLRQEGVSCRYYDLSFFNVKSTLRETIISQLKGCNPSIVGLTSYTSNFNATLEVVKIVKEFDPSILVCVGGPHVSFLDRHSLDESNNKIDVIIRGEGERTMQEIAYYHLKGLPLEDHVMGITTHKKRNPDQKLLSNEELDKIPRLPFDLIPQNERKKKIYISTTATRGCTYHCTFCTNSTFWQYKVRFRPVEKVIEDIIYAQELFPQMDVELIDTILPVKLPYFENLVNSYTNSIENPVSLAMTRANLTDDKRLTLMKKLLQDTGMLLIGVENGAPKILDLMKKPPWEQQLQALKNIKEFDIRSIPSWIVGFCGENLSTMCQNLEKINFLNKKQLVQSIILFMYIPLPGSAPFTNPKHFGINLHSYNWDYYNRCVFPPPYSLFDTETGRVTLTSFQIWGYYLSALGVQDRWYQMRHFKKRRAGLITDFMKKVRENKTFLYSSPYGGENVILFKELIDP